MRDFADPATRRHAFTHETLLHQLQPNAGRFQVLRHATKNIGNVARYYGTLLTSPRSYRGANRRTSINVSAGTLVHPELEMVAMGADHDVHTHEHHRHLKEIERKFEEELEKAEEEIAVAKRVLSGKAKGKGRATGLKLDLGNVKATTPASGSGFDKLIGAKAGTPFAEKGGFDWSGGKAKAKPNLKLDLGAFSFGASSAADVGVPPALARVGSGHDKLEKGGFDWGGKKKPGLKLDLGGFKLGGSAAVDGGPRGLSRADSGFDKIAGAKAGTPFVEKSGFDFSFERSSRSDRDDVDPLAAVDEDEEVAP